MPYVENNITKVLGALSIPAKFFLHPIILLIAGAVAELISVSLLMPLLSGFINQDFKMILSLPILGQLFDFLGLKEHLESRWLFMSLLGVIIFTVTARVYIDYRADLSFAWRQAQLVNNLRVMLFNRAIHFGKSFFDQNNLGQLHSNIIGLPSQIANEIASIKGVFRSAFYFVAYTTAMVLISWKLSLCAVALFFVYMICLKKILYTLQYHTEQFVKANTLLNNLFNKAFSCILLVKSYTAEGKEKNLFANASEQLANTHMMIDRRRALVHPLQEILMMMMASILLCIIYILLRRDTGFTPANFLVYFYLLKRVSTCFVGIGIGKSIYIRVDTLCKTISELLENSDKGLQTDGTRDFSGIAKTIEFQDVNFAYKTTPILKNVSLYVPRGKTVALVGPTGSGKSTIAQLLMRLYDVQSGRIMFDGIDIQEFTFSSLRNSIALVSQESFLFHDSLRNNLTYGLEGEVTEAELHYAIDKARLWILVNSLPEGLETMIGERGVQLSGGEKQRVSIARAILKQAPILILDEATSALDATTERLVQDALDELVLGRTVIVIAHRFATLRSADLIVALEKGQVVQVGTLQELLLEEGLFSTLWREQQLVH